MTQILAVKRALDEVYLLESRAGIVTKKYTLLNLREWVGILTVREIEGLNRTFNKFMSQAPVLYEGVRNRSLYDLWEHFLGLESALLSETDGDDEEKPKSWWQKAKEKGGKLINKVGRKLRSASLEKGGSLFGMGAASQIKGQEGEYIAGDTELGNAMKGALGGHAKYFPNNDSFDEFKDDLTNAVQAGLAHIKKMPSETDEDKKKVGEAIKDLKKWVVYHADYKLGDYYKHFKGQTDKKKEDKVEESYRQKSLSFLLEKDEKEDKKNEYEMGSKREESEAWKGLTSKDYIKGLLAIGMISGGSAFKVLSDSITTVVENLPQETSSVTEVSSKIVEESSGKTFPVEFNFKSSLNQGLADAMKKAGFDVSAPTQGAMTPEKMQNLRNFYDAMGGEGGHEGFFNQLAQKLGKTGQAKDLFVKYMNASYEKGLAPLALGSPDAIPGFKGVDVSGMGMKSPLSIPNGGASFSMTGSLSEKVVKVIVTATIKKMVSGGIIKGSAVAGAGALAGAALVGVGAGALVSIPVIHYLRKRSQKESRLAIMMNLLDEIDKMYEEAGGKPQEVNVPKALPAGPSNDTKALPAGPEGSKQLPAGPGGDEQLTGGPEGERQLTGGEGGGGEDEEDQDKRVKLSALKQQAISQRQSPKKVEAVAKALDKMGALKNVNLAETRAIIRGIGLLLNEDMSARDILNAIKQDDEAIKLLINIGDKSSYDQVKDNYVDDDKGFTSYLLSKFQHEVGFFKKDHIDFDKLKIASDPFMKKTDPYDILGVTKGATRDELKAALRKFAAKHHPDQDNSALAALKMKKANMAYHEIMSSIKESKRQQGTVLVERWQRLAGIR